MLMVQTNSGSHGWVLPTRAAGRRTSESQEAACREKPGRRDTAPRRPHHQVRAGHVHRAPRRLDRQGRVQACSRPPSTASRASGPEMHKPLEGAHLDELPAGRGGAARPRRAARGPAPLVHEPLADRKSCIPFRIPLLHRGLPLRIAMGNPGVASFGVWAISFKKSIDSGSGITAASICYQSRDGLALPQHHGSL